MAFVGWWMETFGALNVAEGEYDTAQYFAVVFGIPVWLSFRGCYHVVGELKDPTSGHARRLLGFRKTHARWVHAPSPGLAEPTSLHPGREGVAPESLFTIPLRRRAALGWMAAFYFLVFALGIASLAAVFSLFRLTNPKPLEAQDRYFMLVSWCFVPAFLLCLFRYRRARLPSERQRRIRSVVRRQLGPFTDPADWVVELTLDELSSSLGSPASEPAAVLGEAEKQASKGDYALALILGRLSIALAEAEGGHPDDVGQAEELTDRCLTELESSDEMGEE